MFKKFLQRIIEAENQEAAWNDVFYGENGIDRAYQAGKLNWKDFEILTALINKMA